MIKKILVGSLFLFGSITASAGEFTGIHEVSIVDITTDTQAIVVIPEGNTWGAAGCPNAGRVVLQPSSPSYKQSLAMILTAQASGATLRFFGDCNGATQFNATLVRLQ